MNRSEQVARADQHLNEARQVAEEMRARAREARESMEEFSSERERYQTEAAEHRARADELETLAEMRRAQGRTQEADEMERLVLDLRRAAEEADGNGEAARQLADEESGRYSEERARQQRTAAEEDRVQASRDKIRQLSDDLDRLEQDITDLQHLLLFPTRFITPEDTTNLRHLRQQREALIAALRNEVTAATGLTDEVREQLRGNTPNTQTRKDIIDNTPSGDAGPNGLPRDWVTGEELDRSDASPDHIYPVRRIFDEPGFGELPRADQEAILEMPENLAPLQRSRNESKSDRSISEWIGGGSEHAPNLTDQQLQAAIDRETRARDAVRQEIQQRLTRWRRR